MQHKDKVLEYYKSGRYECDYEFYVFLHEIVEELNLYEWLPTIQNSELTLKRIKQLTQINAKCLEQDYDDEEGVCQTYKIRSLIVNHLNCKEVPKIIEECQALQWQSYSSKICKLLSGKPEYQSIIERIHTTIHSEQFRIDSMAFTAFFQYINGNKLSACINDYNNTVQYYLAYLSSQRQRFVFLLEGEDYSNIAQLKKVKAYVGVVYFIVRTCLRFCQILKILTGKNNLSLKFTVVKKEIEKLMKKYPQWKFQEEKDELFRVLPFFKGFLKNHKQLKRQKICQWCFKELKNQTKGHSFCNYLVNKKVLFK